MNETSDRPYADFIAALARAFSAFGSEWVIIGGVAVGLVATPRYTADLDALTILDTARVEQLMSFLSVEGFEPLFSDAIKFSKLSRILPLRHPDIDSKVDIALGCMPFEEEVVTRSLELIEGGVRFRVPTPEDLIILKAIANRDQDRADIRSIAQINPSLDRKRIEHWVTQYAELKETPELWSEIEPLLSEE